MNRKRIAKVAVPLALIAVLTTGCGTHSSAPDPASGDVRPGTHARVIKNPFGYRNVAFSCNGTTGVYVTSAGADDSLPSSVAVLANDPACAQ